MKNSIIITIHLAIIITLFCALKIDAVYLVAWVGILMVTASMCFFLNKEVAYEVDIRIR